MSDSSAATAAVSDGTLGEVMGRLVLWHKTKLVCAPWIDCAAFRLM